MDGQRREDCRTSTAFMSEEGAQLRTAHSGRGGGVICLCLCLHLCDTVCGIHVCV